MRIKRLFSAVIAGALSAAVFSACGENGKIDSNKGNSAGSDLSDAVSDIGNGAGDIVSDIGDGVSDIGEDISDGIGDMTGNGSEDKEHVSEENKSSAADSDNSARHDEDQKNAADDAVNNAANDPPLRDGSVSALNPVETQKKTNKV